MEKRPAGGGATGRKFGQGVVGWVGVLTVRGPAALSGYLSVEVPPCLSDGREADCGAAPPDPPHDVLVLQRLHRLPVDGQQKVPVLHPDRLGWTPRVHLPQHVD